MNKKIVVLFSNIFPDQELKLKNDSTINVVRTKYKLKTIDISNMVANGLLDVLTFSSLKEVVL